MEAAKLAVLQKPRPLAQSFFVLALDGVVQSRPCRRTTGVKISSCSSALGSRSDGQRPTLTAAFGGSVRRAPRRPSSPRRAGGRSSTRRSRSREASTISGRTGPLDPGHFDASRGDMSVLVQKKLGGAGAIAQGPCRDRIAPAPPSFCVHHRARARGSPGGARRALRVVVVVSAGPRRRSTRLRHSRGV